MASGFTVLTICPGCLLDGSRVARFPAGKTVAQKPNSEKLEKAIVVAIVPGAGWLLQ